MFRTQVKFSKDQTPEQRAAHAQHWRRQDALKRAQCNWLQFWRMCRTPLCRRNHACCGDMHACFERHWWPMPEDEKEYVRGAIKAAAEGMPADGIVRAANAARGRYLDMIEKQNAEAAAKAQAAAAPAPKVQTPQARIRTL